MIQMVKGTSGEQFPDGYENLIDLGIHLRLPNSYLSFMRTTNGGVPVQKKVQCGSMEFVVERFLSAIPDLSNSAIAEYDIEVVHAQILDRLNDFLCPFAVIFAGDFLCFDWEEREEARVVLWDHELSEEEEPKLFHVCDTFEEFQSNYPNI